ncbi:YceI family protein [Dokdonia sp. Asnod2-E02]|uniref:YceI family protein n=1 Tax=Dokdonia sp. Asnod2-E02 TaxID=3160574 RepID=UPI00386EC46C
MYKLISTLIILVVTSQIHSQVVAPETHNLDTGKSILHWKGSYVFNVSEHNGEVYFKDGYLNSINDNVIGGSFTIDMTSITNEDHLHNRGPVTHLKDEDFFYIEKYPEASLTITSITYFEDTNTHEVFADLTIKEVTKNIKFYAILDGQARSFKAHFKIDRTRWGITYNNEVKNRAISEAIEFKADLQF